MASKFQKRDHNCFLWSNSFRHSTLEPENKTLNLEENQAAAAMSQIELAYSWKAALEKFNFKMCSQILLSPDDTEA